MPYQHKIKDALVAGRDGLYTVRDRACSAVNAVVCAAQANDA